MEPGFNVVGHTTTIAMLQRAIAVSRLHHALLFVGPDGIGKRQVAQGLARLLNCAHPHADGPCNSCRSCERIIAKQHPDVVSLAPDTSKAKWVIKIELIRDVTRQVRYKPYEGKRRVVLIDHAETLTHEGANAFLKTLEEPTGDTLFVLLTSQPQRLLATIRSRCQLVRFSPLMRNEVQSILVKDGVDAAVASVAAGYSEGSLSRAQAICKEGALEDRREFIEQILDLRDADLLEVLALAAEQARRDKQELRADLDALKVFYRDVVLVRSGASMERVVNLDLADRARKIASWLTVESAIRCIEAIDSAENGLRSYINAQLLLEQLLLTLAESLRAKRSSPRVGISG